MYFELKENKPHGTKDDPCSIYHIANAKRSFQIPIHWHDEFEIIYVKSGFLTVSISGENYICLLYTSVYEMEVIGAGEEFYAEMKRSTNGGGENSPVLEGEDDFYELFFAGL